MKHLGDHQIYAIECMDCTDNLGIFYQPGCGKTAIALTWALESLKNGLIDDVLVICPASLVANWALDIDEFDDFDHVSEADVALLKDKITVISYQKTYKMSKKEVKHRDGYTSTSKEYALRDEVDKPWGAIFIDESQKLGNHKSIQTLTCLKLAKMAQYRFIMSGTPVLGSSKTGGEDLQKLYGQLKFLNNDIWRNWTDFTTRYVTSWSKYYQPLAYKVDELHALMKEMAISMRLEDCYDLPETTLTKIPCKLEEKKAYTDIKAGKRLEYDIEIKAAGGQYGKLLQLCSGHLITNHGTEVLKCSKDDALEEILDGTDDKVVIFCRFTASIDRVKALCEKKKLRTVVYDGRSKGPTWQIFRDGKADVIILQYAAGGTGLNLQISSTMVMYEPCFSTNEWDQATARIRRIGQRKMCRYLILTTPETIEANVYDNVLNGISVTEDMLKRWTLHNDI